MSTTGVHVRLRHDAGVITRDTHRAPNIEPGWAPDQPLAAQQQIPGGDILPGTVTGSMLAPGSLDSPTPFADNLKPPQVVDALPTLPDGDFPLGCLVVLTTDGKLYRNVLNLWNKEVDGNDLIANSVKAASIEAGAIGAREIAAQSLHIGLFKSADLIRNGGFEEDGKTTASGQPISGWLLTGPYGSQTVVDTNVRSGSYALQLAQPSTPDYPTVASELAPFKGGARVRYRLWVRGLASNSATAAIRLRIRMYDAGGVQLGSASAPHVIGANVTYQELLLDWQVMDATAYVQLEFQNDGTSGGFDTILVDDVEGFRLDGDLWNAGGDVYVDKDGMVISNGKLSVVADDGRTVIQGGRIATGAITVDALAARGANLISNGDFEMAPKCGFGQWMRTTDNTWNWSGVSGTDCVQLYVSGYAKSGTHVMQIRGNTVNSYPAVWFNKIPVRPGQTYRLSGYLAKNSGAYSARFRMDAKAADGSTTVVTGAGGALENGTGTLTFMETYYTVPLDGSVSILHAVAYLNGPAAATSSDIVVFEDLTIEEVSAGAANSDGTVVIDNNGILIKNGKLTLQDEFDKQVLGAAGFAGSWSTFLAYGLYNATFADGQTTTLATGRGVQLPYWTITQSNASLYRDYNSGFPGQYRVYTNFSAVNGWVQIESDPVSVVSGWTYAMSLGLQVSRAAGTLSTIIYIDSYRADGTLLSSLGPMAFNTSVSVAYQRWPFGMASFEVNAAYVKVRVKMQELTAHSSTNHVFLGFVAVTRSTLASDIDGGYGPLTVDSAYIGEINPSSVFYTDATLVNGWQNYGGSFATAGYWKDALGVVHLKGLIRNGTTGAAAFTLPVGMRIAEAGIYAALCSGSIGRIDIAATGTVSPSATGYSGWISLNGISFPAEG